MQTTTPTGTRAFALEPAEVEHHGMYLRGRFRIAKKVNATAEANKLWRATKPAVAAS